MFCIRAAALVVVSILVVGCSSAPKMAEPLEMPEVPIEQPVLVEAELTIQNDRMVWDNVVQPATHTIRPNSSVVINVPDDKVSNQAQEQDFTTKNFFNEAEQQIEIELMRSGFRVLSRARFEAKLRQLRDETTTDLRSRVSPEVRPILDDLNERFEQGEISAADYAAQIQEFKARFQTSSSGRSRDENERELTDISEVIRAADDGDIQSDYVLQINIFDSATPKYVPLDLRHNDELRAFVRDNPAIQPEFSQSENHTVTCAIVESKLNAKLIHIKTGEVAWIGEHRLNEYSADVQSVFVELGYRRYVSNADDIERFVRRQNRENARIQRYGQETTIPDFEYNHSLLGPTISGGTCNQEVATTDEVKVALARAVAKELISTITIDQ